MRSVWWYDVPVVANWQKRLRVEEVGGHSLSDVTPYVVGTWTDQEGQGQVRLRRATRSWEFSSRFEVQMRAVLTPAILGKG